MFFFINQFITSLVNFSNKLSTAEFVKLVNKTFLFDLTKIEIKAAIVEVFPAKKNEYLNRVMLRKFQIPVPGYPFIKR